VQLKIDAEFPRFTQSMLETLYPHYLAPTPSMAVVEVRPDLTQKAIDAGYVLPRGTVLRSQTGKGEMTPCKYLTAHDLTLLPITISAAAYHGRDVATLRLPRHVEAKAAIRVTLECAAGRAFKDLEFDDVVLYIRGGELAMSVYEQFFARCNHVVARPGGGRTSGQVVLDARENLTPVGYRDDEALLPHSLRSFRGYRLLSEYFTLPERFMFAKISGLAEAASRCAGGQLEIIMALEEGEPELESAVDETLFALHCTPAINLFPHRADRINVTDRHAEIEIVPDRTRPLDFEVYRLTNVAGLIAGRDDERQFRPFYSATDLDAETGEGAGYYVVNRVPRAASEKTKKRGSRSSYVGSQVFVSFVDPKAAPYDEDLKQLSIEALCTNRDLPLQMPVGRGKSDFTLEVAAPVTEIKCIAGPTAPMASVAEGEFSWRLISHLSLNYLSLIGDESGEGALRLRDLLRLYANLSSPDVRKQIDGLIDVSSKPLMRRVAANGPISFARGLEVALTFDESAFEGTGVFVLGGVLAKFFSKYVSINSFTETVIKTAKRGEIMRWRPQVGQRHIL